MFNDVNEFGDMKTMMAKAKAAAAKAAKPSVKKPPVKKTPWYEVINENFLEFGDVNEFGDMKSMMAKAVAAKAAAAKAATAAAAKADKHAPILAANLKKAKEAAKKTKDSMSKAASDVYRNVDSDDIIKYIGMGGADLFGFGDVNEYGKKLKMTKKAIAARRAYRRKKSSKRSRRSSPKRRKISQKTARARAKRAMKLHHSKGISLKQAWRIVLKKNKFGDSVCGRGYEVNRNWNRTKGQRECLKECDFYEIRDNKTNKCKKMKMVNKTYGYVPPRYVPPRPRSRVPRGYEINPETGRQRKICPPGHYRDPDTGRCKRIQSSVRPLISRKNYEDLDELDSVNFRWSKKTRGNLPLSMQYGHGKSCFGAVPCDCGM